MPFQKGKDNPGYIDGKTLKKYYCKCGEELSGYDANICRDCYYESIRDNGNPNFKYDISAETIFNLYWIKDLSIKQVADIFGCNPVTIYKKMFKYHIPRKTLSEAREGKFTGEDNSGWKGGISNEPYAFEFNQELRERIRKRDNYICQLCGLTEEEHLVIYGQVLLVHHINYDKKNCEEDNFVSLCRQCHARTNFNRGYWENYFNSLIKTLRQKSIINGGEINGN